MWLVCKNVKYRMVVILAKSDWEECPERLQTEGWEIIGNPYSDWDKAEQAAKKLAHRPKLFYTRLGEEICG